MKARSSEELRIMNFYSFFRRSIFKQELYSCSRLLCHSPEVPPSCQLRLHMLHLSARDYNFFSHCSYVFLKEVVFT